MDEVEHLKEQLDKAEKFISQIEENCSYLVDEIIDTVCKNAIKRMNSKMEKFRLCDDYPQSFTFFDQLSVLHQSRDYDEIFFPNGVLEDYLENTLDLELDNIPLKDKIILWYSDCRSQIGHDYEIFDARHMCYQRFNDFQNKRYEELLPDLDEF